MTPTLLKGDYLLVRRFSRRRPVRAGDVVVTSVPRKAGLKVKRADHREADGWWLLGDNEFVTSDSREFGAVDEGMIRARGVLRIRDCEPAWRFWGVRFARVGLLAVPARELGYD